MKILIVNSIDKGGAANACLRLHAGLFQEGIDSKVLLREKQKETLHTYTLKPQQKKVSKSQKIVNKFIKILRSYGILKKRPIPEKLSFLKNREKGLEFYSFPDSSFDITASKLYRKADIINFHWVADFLDFQSFFKKNTKPVVWTLHDMNPFTGGEHYKEEYLGIDNTGRPLKREVTKDEKIRSESNLELKKEALSKIKNMNIIAPSRWLADEAKKSELFNAYPVHHIPYGLDSHTYKPLDQTFARRLLSIPENKKVILFVADSIDNQRKGFIYLKRAFRQLSDKKDLVLCAIGKTSETISDDLDIINLGVIKDERLMSAAYNAADAFVIPSLMDNLPNTVIESLMCGTPVIGFPVGGIPEMIRDGENGFVAKEISVNALVESLKTFLNTMDNFNRKNIRTKAVEKYDLKIQAGSYIKLFESILK
ncbi:glycosyltransferase [Salegentibacter sp. JZCK2]|uniref:glycosyltransferase n=1 Tax=Salegentibacter tibetensis TaxID=2873600 RepID=UPI001CC8F777|nr:glycosyltransferase [Salegentibacter tibetensis]MBZ9729741.1 glycosyltransferase [Salegentibacter tibetensis]